MFFPHILYLIFAQNSPKTVFHCRQTIPPSFFIDSRAKSFQFSVRNVYFCVTRDNCQTRSSYLWYLRMCFVLKRRDRSALKWFYAQWTSGIVAFVATDALRITNTTLLDDCTFVLQSKTEKWQGQAPLRQFTVYDVTYDFSQLVSGDRSFGKFNSIFHTFVYSRFPVFTYLIDDDVLIYSRLHLSFV